MTAFRSRTLGEDLPAAEGQQLAGQRAGPLAGRDGSRGAAACNASAASARPQGLRRVADDDGEQVVEVVGHAAGEPADGLHLLRLPQGLGRPKALAGVAEHQNGPYDVPRFVLDRAR